MKKIGIITIFKINNYGAELQAFALQYKLNKLGYDSEIIDYPFYKNKNHKKEDISKPLFKLPRTIRLKEFLFPLIENIKLIPHKKEKKKREYRFEKFRNSNIKTSLKTYNSYSSLYNDHFDYDVFCAGSDQIWNPYNNTSLNPYFLTFAPKEKIKFSYGSSFGVSSIDECAKNIYANLISGLNKISVREKRGVEIVKDISGRSATDVLDPTLLLNKDDWESIAKYPYKKEKYLLVYKVTNSIAIDSIAKKIAKENNLKIIILCKQAIPECKDIDIINIMDAGPAEFVGLFLNASFIVTNSFHGTAFSVNLEKPFLTVLKNKPNNNRQEGLLSILRLSNRLIYESSTTINDICYPEINFATSSEILENERRKSVNYILNAIK